jgi:Ribbon-helix-helix protein, copG family
MARAPTCTVSALMGREPKWRDLSWSKRYARQKARWHYQMVRLDRDDLPALRRMARQQNISVSELIRTFVAWGLENEDRAP